MCVSRIHSRSERRDCDNNFSIWGNNWRTGKDCGRRCCWKTKKEWHAHTSSSRSSCSWYITPNSNTSNKSSWGNHCKNLNQVPTRELNTQFWTYSRLDADIFRPSPTSEVGQAWPQYGDSALIINHPPPRDVYVFQSPQCPPHLSGTPRYSHVGRYLPVTDHPTIWNVLHHLNYLIWEAGHVPCILAPCWRKNVLGHDRFLQAAGITISFR